MELNREKIIKALECCTFNPRCEECPIGGEDCINLDQLALSLIKELTEENERLNAQRYMLYSNGKLEMIPTVESVKADTVRKMQERFFSLLEKEYRENTPVGADHYFKNGSLMMRGIAEKVFDQIAKEMLEGNNENND